MPGDGLQGAQWVCRCLHCRYRHMYGQIEGVALARSECGTAWSMEGLFTSTSPRVSLGVSDGTDHEGEILPHAVGVWVKCGADNHEGYCQYCVGTRGTDKVKVKFKSFGLTCKDPEHLKHGAKVLGLKVWGSVTPYVGSEELQFQNPLLRWHDAQSFPCVRS